ncbi:MAG: acyltransferase [Cytophagales bacterium]|nr:MAG: acyltransferase [Cytophagales bacterium]
MQRVFFNNLNTVHFIAASVVIVNHIEQVKSMFGLNNIWNNHIIKQIGELGVLLFFVLSGFLITYLLLEEKKYLKTIHIEAFYIRRFLRIWPLYYLIVIISIVILNKVSLFEIPHISQNFYDTYLYIKIVLFILMLPNITLLFFGVLPYASQTWSIGIEEQFYLFWTRLIKKFKYPFKSLVVV